MEFLDAALAWPTGIFTLLLGVAVLYWIFVIVGALDIHFLSFDGAAEGLAEGAAEGAAEGVADGVADGLGHGAADGLGHGAAGGLGHHHEGTLAGLLAALNLRAAPVTVVLTFVFLIGWLASFFGMRALATLGLGGLVVAALVGVGAVIIALPLTALAVRPMAPLFRTAHARSRAELMGGTCQIATGWVDDRFGQANVRLGNDHLLIQVRCRAGNGLHKGDEALIIEFDAARQAYVIEPLRAG